MYVFCYLWLLFLFLMPSVGYVQLYDRSGRCCGCFCGWWTHVAAMTLQLVLHALYCCRCALVGLTLISVW